ncbi:MAG TPA: hypothetical protein VN966_03165 [Candidatus Bathyarchaeia archaeon]|nr:hypothetical protein [Candidatus Bathyarchaeia archaeon]
MKKGFWGFAALGSMLTALLLAAVPAGAQGVDDKIKALEQELTDLKSQQIELKKESTAAAAALPTFSYRPGNGVDITAADKSWGLRFSMEAHIRTIFESGQDAIGRTNGEVMLRRWRPYFFYCIDNCLYEIEMGFDMDGFGTGNAKNSTNSATSSIMQRGVVHFHLENLNPFLPTVDIGGDVSTAFSLSRQGSSAVGTQMDYDLLTRNFGPNTGRAGWGYVFNWDDRSLSGIGIPGRLGRFEFAMASINEGDDNLSSFTDRKDFNLYASIFPFSELKNKWIQGLMFEMGAWFCNIDQRTTVDNGCSRLRIQDNGDAARQTLFDTSANSIGEGLTTLLSPGITWEIGPYRLRAMGAFLNSQDGNFKPGPVALLRGKKQAHDFLIGHDLYLWSPKGFLTGSANTPGSILVGTHFERTDVACNTPPAGRCNAATVNGGQFHRGVYVIREWDLWYFVAPRMSVGGSLLWYNASNLTTTVQQNLGCTSRGSTGRIGGGCQWIDGNLNWRYQF